MELVVLSINPLMATPRPDPVVAGSSARVTRSFQEVFREVDTSRPGVSAAPVPSPSSALPAAPQIRPVGTASAEYQVRKGDTLWGICRREMLQSGTDPDSGAVHARVMEVANANGLANPDQLSVGQRLRMGGDTTSAHAPPVAAATPKAGIPAAPPSFPAVAEEELPAPMIPVAPRSTAVAPTLRAPAGHMKTQPLETQPIPAGGGECVARKQPAPARAAVAKSEAPEARPMRKVVADLSDMLQNLLESSGATRMAEGGRSPWKPILENGSTRLTSGFGMRKDPFTGSLQHHDGVDIAAPQGTKVFPYKPGRVAFSGWDGGYGKVVKIHHDDGTETRYGHASALLVEPGQRVTQETAIAKVGSTGRSTGPHLHFEIRVNGRPVDPVPYLKGDPVQLASAAYK